MGWPERPWRLPIRVEAAFGADPAGSPAGWEWTDVTADLPPQQITINRGPGDESPQAQPTSVSLELDNPRGDYTPHNPLSAHYPHVTLGVPLRLSVQAGTPYLKLPGNNGDLASAPDAPPLDITGDIDIRLDATLTNWAAPGSVELAGKFTLAAGGRSWLLMMRAGRPHFEWSVNGSDVIQTDATAAPASTASGRMALRVTLDVDDGAGGHVVTFYTAPSGVDGPWTRLGAPLVLPGTTSIFTSPAPLRIADAASLLGFAPAAGAWHALQVRSGIDGMIVANPDFGGQQPDTAAFTDSAGRPWSTAGNAEITNWQTRFVGSIDEWAPTWPYGDLTREDTGYAGEARVGITASGMLRRMSQGAKALQSTLRRRIPSDPTLLAYWPMEDGRNATQAYSPLFRVRPMTVHGATFAADDSLPGSSPLPSLKAGASFSGTVPATATPAAWHTEFVYYIETPPTAHHTVMRWRGNGTVAQWSLQLKSGEARIVGQDSDGAAIEETLIGPFSNSDLFGAWNRWQFRARQAGPSVTWETSWINIGGGGLHSGGSYTGTLGRITGVQSAPGLSSELDGMRVGHIGVFNTIETLIYNDADTGFTGERAGDRLRRLATEEGLALAIVGDPAATQPMGPQRPTTLLELLAECAAVDGGILGEQRDHPGLRYRTRGTLYNQIPALSLNARRNEITHPFSPVLDDQRRRNDVTVSRENGSSARVTDTASIAATGLRDEQIVVNAATDDQLPDIAAWRLHLGTWPGMRYPSVATELALAPQQITAWLASDSGDRLHVTHLPPQHPTDTVDLLMQGYRETLSPTQWTAQITCSPAGPWTVGVVQDTVLGRVDAGASVLAAAVTTTATSLDVLTPTGRPWITSTALPAEFPLDVATGGEVMRVTACTGTGATQTFTVTRGINGIVKAHSPGQPITLANPAVAAL